MTAPDKIITSAANPVIKQLRALNVKKYREADNLFLVEGARHIHEALVAGWTVAVLAFSPRAENAPEFAALKLIAQEQKAECLSVTDELLQRITERDNAQAVVAALRPRTFALDEARAGLWVALENIRDPGNLGTIIRTAEATGAEGIILLGDTCDPWSPEAIRATMGSFSRQKIIVASNADFIAWRKNYSGRVIGTHLYKAKDYRDAHYTRPMILLMGSEQAGLSDALVTACDACVKIPMTGQIESLNLAVATGVMLYQIADLKA